MLSENCLPINLPTENGSYSPFQLAAAAKEDSTGRSFTRLHTFDQKGLYHTLYGVGYGKNPIVNVIDTAAKWLHENNLGK